LTKQIKSLKVVS